MIDSSTRDYVAVTQQELAGWVDRLTDVDTGAADGELIDQITELEKIKAACAAAQAALTLAFHTSRSRGLSSTELRNEGTHRSINAQIALARRDSPVRGGRHVGLARALIREMPHTYTALRTGQISEWRATLLTRETACLTAADRTPLTPNSPGDWPPWATSKPRPPPPTSPNAWTPRTAPNATAKPPPNAGSASAPPPTP